VESRIVLTMGNSESLDVWQAFSNDFHAKYSVGQLLGKGSQGRVYNCTNKASQMECAVKVIDRSVKTAWASYTREVELCRACTSQYVVQLFEEFSDGSNCYVIMEKYEGHLRKCLKSMQKDADDKGHVLVLNGMGNAGLRNVCRQVSIGVRHLHRLGIIHRDVKAHNILSDRLNLRDERCRVVLSDFGLARRLESGRSLSAQVGTRKYWAPELYEKKYGHAVDVFAIGVVQFLLGTGFYPYMDEKQTREHDVFAADRVPECLLLDGQEFMQATLQKDPAQRPTAEELVRHPWLKSDMGEHSEEEVTEDPSLQSGMSRNVMSIQRFGPKAISHFASRPESFAEVEHSFGVRGGLVCRDTFAGFEADDDILEADRGCLWDPPKSATPRGVTRVSTWSGDEAAVPGERVAVQTPLAGFEPVALQQAGFQEGHPLSPSRERTKPDDAAEMGCGPGGKDAPRLRLRPPVPRNRGDGRARSKKDQHHESKAGDSGSDMEDEFGGFKKASRTAKAGTKVRPSAQSTEKDLQAHLDGLIEEEKAFIELAGKAHTCATRHPKGASVEYFSETFDKWIPAVVKGFDEVNGTYKLNVHSEAPQGKIRPAPKSGYDALAKDGPDEAIKQSPRISSADEDEADCQSFSTISI